MYPFRATFPWLATAFMAGHGPRRSDRPGATKACAPETSMCCAVGSIPWRFKRLGKALAPAAPRIKPNIRNILEMAGWLDWCCEEKSPTGLQALYVPLRWGNQACFLPHHQDTCTDVAGAYSWIDRDHGRPALEDLMHLDGAVGVALTGQA